jgi:mannosyl-3-phosphoglycerate phosphatase
VFRTQPAEARVDDGGPVARDGRSAVCVKNRTYRASLRRVTLSPALLAPRHIIYTALEGALLDARTGSFAEAEEALSELTRRHVPLVLVTSRTREEIEPLRRQMEHSHPFITESGGGIYFPDGYFNIKIPDVRRSARYLCLALGQPYEGVCDALDEVAEASGVGVAGFHHMSRREIAENTGLKQRDADLARSREFDEPFFFTSADEKAIARFIAMAKQRGFQARLGQKFWHFSSGCDSARAVRSLTKLFRDATRIKLRAVGIAPASEDLPWLGAVDQAVSLGAPESASKYRDTPPSDDQAPGMVPGPAGWNRFVLDIIS